MRLLDPLEGVKALGQSIAFQCVFSASSLLMLIKYWRSPDSHVMDLNEWNAILHNKTQPAADPAVLMSLAETEDQIDYNKTQRNLDEIVLELFISHMIVVVLWALPRLMKCLSRNSWWVFAKVCECISIAAYVRAMFIACTDYPKLYKPEDP